MRDRALGCHDAGDDRLALGAHAGPARIEEVVTATGFRHFRQAGATPLNLVFEARP